MQMSYAEFMLLAFNNIDFLVILSIILMLLLYWGTFRISGGLSDPFHFYYAFTYGTSYAVVGLLAIKGYVGFPEIAIVVGYGVVFLVAYRSFSRLYFPWVHRTVSIVDGGRTFFQIAIVAYFIAALIYVMLAGLPSFSENRFRTNQGFGFFVRFLEPLRLFIVGYLALRITANRKGKKTFWLGCGEISFMIVSSLLNGAKFAFLEVAYVAAVAIAISTGRKALPIRKIVWPTLVVFSLATVYALAQMSINYHKADSSVGTDAQYIAGAPLLVEQFSVRIISNGDVYFMGLPPPVLDSIHVDHPVEQMFGGILGGGAIASLLGYPKGNDIGEQVKAYWYPFSFDPSGPTDHFDLTAYLYFGPVLGVLFVLCLALILAQITRLKQYRYSTVGCAAVAALYCNSLVILLTPPAGIMLIFDTLTEFAALTVLARILNTANSTIRHSILSLPAR
jgi:hypothetical protein